MPQTWVYSLDDLQPLEGADYRPRRSTRDSSGDKVRGKLWTEPRRDGFLLLVLLLSHLDGGCRGLKVLLSGGWLW